MKKIILMFILIPNIVFAETIYTEYEPFLLNTNKYLEETDLLKREEIKLYNTYKEELEEKYLSLDDSLSSEYQIDYNDYNYLYTNSIENSKYSYNFHTKCLNDNFTPKSLTINNFNNNFKITEVQVSSSKLQGVGISINNFKGFMSFIANGIIDEIPIELNQQGYINLNFYKNIEIDDLQIKLYLPKQDLNELSFEITSKDGIKLTNKIILNNNKENIITINFDKDYYKFLEENNFNILNNCISYYKLKIPLYKHIKLNKVLSNNYIPLNNTDLFELEDYKIIYNYYQRNKIEIADNFILQEQEFNLQDYIISTTIPLEDLKVITNINYEQEGKYNIEIYYKELLLSNKLIDYKIINKKENKKIESSQATIKQETFKKEEDTIIKTTTKKTNLKMISNKNKVTSNSVKQLNNKTVPIVNNYDTQKSILIVVISSLILILILFESILLYVNKKYY